MKKQLKLYRICQEVYRGYSTYDSAVVATFSEEEARKIVPSKIYEFMKNGRVYSKYFDNYLWVNDSSKVSVEFLGIAKQGIEPGIIVASFNAG